MYSIQEIWFFFFFFSFLRVCVNIRKNCLLCAVNRQSCIPFEQYSVFFFFLCVCGSVTKFIKKNIERWIENHHRHSTFSRTLTSIKRKMKIKKREKEIKRRNKKKRKISYTILLFFTSRMYIRTKRKSDDDISSFLQATRWNDFFT